MGPGAPRNQDQGLQTFHFREVQTARLYPGDRSIGEAPARDETTLRSIGPDLRKFSEACRNRGTESSLPEGPPRPSGSHRIRAKRADLLCDAVRRRSAHLRVVLQSAETCERQLFAVP